jgi:hypothetical protein
MCRTPAEADEMIAALEAKKLKLAIAHQTRYSPVSDLFANSSPQGRSGGCSNPRPGQGIAAAAARTDGIGFAHHGPDASAGREPQWCFARVFEGGRP